MSRNCNLNVSCCPPPCSIPCPVICCTPPVSYPCMPYVPRAQCRVALRCQPTPKPTKTVLYLPPCPTCPMSCPPKMEVTYLPPPPPPSFYVCETNCVPCIPPCPPYPSCPPCSPCPPCPVMRTPSCKMLCSPCPPC